MWVRGKVHAMRGNRNREKNYLEVRREVRYFTGSNS